MFGKKHASLAGKLLLSTALVAGSLAYGWWQRHEAAGPNLAKTPMPVPPAPARLSTKTRAEAAPIAPKAAATAPQTNALAAAIAPPAGRSQQRSQSENADLPASPSAAPLSALASLRMYQPPPAQVPLPLVTGTPLPGATPLIPPGTHLEDGDYLSDMQQFEWGDLTVKISVHGGQITGVQMVQYPDHRAESLDISRRASPLLDSEVIKTQQSKVDIVSGATDTSYVFRDAVASAIVKATR